MVKYFQCVCQEHSNGGRNSLQQLVLRKLDIYIQNEAEPYLTLYIKNYSKWIKELNVGTKAILRIVILVAIRWYLIVIHHTHRNVQEHIIFLSLLQTLVVYYTSLDHTDDGMLLIIIVRLSIFSNVPIYLFIKYLLCIYYVPSTGPGMGYSEGLKADRLLHL